MLMIKYRRNIRKTVPLSKKTIFSYKYFQMKTRTKITGRPAKKRKTSLVKKTIGKRKAKRKAKGYGWKAYIPGQNSPETTTEFLKKNHRYLHMGEIEKKAKLPSGVLRHIAKGRRATTPAQHQALEQVLRPLATDFVLAVVPKGQAVWQMEDDI